MKRMLFIAAVVLACLGGTVAQEPAPLWLRYPAISPDGQTLLFEYKGDIWSIPASGGNAIPLTLSDSWDARREMRREQSDRP
jgi:tricorn protease